MIVIGDHVKLKDTEVHGTVIAVDYSVDDYAGLVEVMIDKAPPSQVYYEEGIIAHFTHAGWRIQLEIIT